MPGLSPAKRQRFRLIRFVREFSTHLGGKAQKQGLRPESILLKPLNDPRSPAPPLPAWFPSVSIASNPGPWGPSAGTRYLSSRGASRLCGRRAPANAGARTFGGGLKLRLLEGELHILPGASAIDLGCGPSKACSISWPTAWGRKAMSSGWNRARTLLRQPGRLSRIASSPTSRSCKATPRPPICLADL